MWSAVQEKVYKGRIKDVDRLTAWDKLDQRVIDTAVRQSQTEPVVLTMVAYNSLVLQIFVLNFISFCLIVQGLYNKNHGVPCIVVSLNTFSQ